VSQRVAVCCSGLRRVAAGCNVLQYVAVCTPQFIPARSTSVFAHARMRVRAWEFSCMILRMPQSLLGHMRLQQGVYMCAPRARVCSCARVSFLV